MAIGAWLVAFMLLIAAAVSLSARGRSTPTGLVPRWTSIGLALAILALAGASVWVWGGGAAIEGRAQRLRDGVPVRLSLTSVAVDVAAGAPATIGWSASATLRLPAGPGATDDTSDL